MAANDTIDWDILHIGAQHLSQCVMDAKKGRIEARWQTYMTREMVNLKAKDILSTNIYIIY